MTKQWIISSDSHVLEPEDLYKPIAKKYGDQVPRYTDRFQGRKGKFYFTGLEYIQVDEIIEGDETPAKKRLQQKLIRASMDPYARLQCIDEDGVWAEVLNSTWMLYTMRATNDRMVEDCCRLYNDWVGELASANPNRLKATAMIHMADVDWACKELDRVAKKGHVSALVNCDSRPDWAPYRDKKYDKFWARCQAHGIPPTLHIITGNIRDPFTLFGKEREELPRLTLQILSESFPVLANEFIFGGIMDRFSKMNVVLSEYEVSWLPYVLFRMYQIEGPFADALKFKLPKHKVDDYMKRVWHGFVDDKFVNVAVQAVGAKNLMWGSDFPHARCTYPNSQKVVQKTLGHLGAKAMADLSYYNCARLYNIDLPKNRVVPAKGLKAAAE
ncbi:MAG: hypothetical protein EXQ91_03505 [Alphaproteobacteria bacterium]|nr:hypothetical protein [Alphaproteobacteria bacterium]